MKQSNIITPKDMEAAAELASERVEEKKSQGLCARCGTSPANPHLQGHVCLTCHSPAEHYGCEISGCPNSSDTTFLCSEYCKPHFAQAVFELYEEYLTMKDMLESKREDFRLTIEEIGTHPRNYDPRAQGTTSKMESAHDEWIQLKYMAREVNTLKSEVEHAMEDDIEVFPDEYKVFG